MWSSIDFVKYVSDQAYSAWKITYKKMFWEYGIYLDWKFVACICDDQFLLKPTQEVKELLEEIIEVPPYPWAKNYFLIENLENTEYLANIMRVTYNFLPEPKPKKPKKK